MNEIVPIEFINSKIYVLRGEKVMLDFDLAELYGVATKRFNEQVSRNIARFPADFMFELSEEEFGLVRSHFATGSDLKRNIRFKPRAFTEQGVAMLSGVLRSERAVQTNISIMRAFVNMRKFMLSTADLERRLDQMESKFDGQFETVFDALRALMKEEQKPKNPIGYIKPQEEAS